MNNIDRQHNVVTTAYKSSAVTGCLSAHFTAPTQLNLIVAKGTRLEVHLVTPDDGPQPLLEVPIYGRIATLRKFRPTVRTICIVLSRSQCRSFVFCLLSHRYEYRNSNARFLSQSRRRKIGCLFAQKQDSLLCFLTTVQVRCRSNVYFVPQMHTHSVRCGWFQHAQRAKL